jgi:hypothetical protein
MATSSLGTIARWILRGISVLIGLVLLLLGGATAALAVHDLVANLNQPGPGKFGLDVQIVAIGILVVVTLFGAVLIWLGLRRGKPAAEIKPAVEIGFSNPSVAAPAPSATTAFPSATAAARPVAAATDSVITGVPVELGRLIGRCGPEQDGQLHYVVMGVILLVFAGLCFIAPWTFMKPKPGDEQMIQIVSLLATAVCALFGVVLTFGPLMARAQTILLFEGGLLEHVGSKSRLIQVEEIQHLRLQEFYEHRFAPRTFNLQARVPGQRDLKFSSSLRGDGEKIVAYLADHVANVEMVPFMG